MIEKFNNIWYLLIFLIHFIGIGIYAYQTIFQTRKFFWPLHLQNALPSEFKTNETLSISENLGSNGLYLPIGDHINKKDQEFISNKIKSFFIE